MAKKEENTMKYLVIAQIVLIVVLMLQVNGINNKLEGGAANVPSNDGGNDGGDAPQPSGDIDMAKLVDDDASIGPKNAKVVIVEFSDFECPYCGAAMGTHDQLIQRFKSSDPSWEAAVPKLKELAEQGKIRLVFRDFPLTNIHKQAQPAAIAAECAGEQEKFWEYHDLLFENQESLNEANYAKWAGDLGLDVEDWNKCRQDPKTAQEVAKDLADGSAVGVRGTPAFIVNGQLLSGAQPYAAFEQIINAELAK